MIVTFHLMWIGFTRTFCCISNRTLAVRSSKAISSSVHSNTTKSSKSDRDKTEMESDAERKVGLQDDSEHRLPSLTGNKTIQPIGRGRGLWKTNPLLVNAGVGRGKAGRSAPNLLPAGTSGIQETSKGEEIRHSRFMVDNKFADAATSNDKAGCSSNPDAKLPAPGNRPVKNNYEWDDSDSDYDDPYNMCDPPEPVQKRTEEEEMLRMLKEAHPNESEDFLLRAVQMHNQSCQGYLSKSSSQNRIWLQMLHDVAAREPQGSNQVNRILQQIFSQTPDPYDTSLFLCNNAEDRHHKTSKTNSLCVVIMKEFAKWISSRRAAYEHLLDQDVKLSAFAIAISRQKQMAAFDFMVKAFNMCHEGNDYFVPCVRVFVLNRKFKEAVQCIRKLGLQDHFKFEEVLFPLILENNNTLVESYVYQNQKWQYKLVEHLDQMCNPDIGMGHMFYESRVRTINLDLEKMPKIFEKMAVRLMKLYQIPSEHCPFVLKKRAQAAIRYWIHMRYDQQKSVEAASFEDMILNIVGSDADLHEYVVDQLIELNQLDDAAEWARKLQLDEDRILPVILPRLRDLEEKQQNEPTCAESLSPEENWDEEEEDWGDVTHYRLTLPLSSVKLVQTKTEYLDSINYVIRDGSEVGMDCEWRPTVLACHSQAKVALLQLALPDQVFLLDLPALLLELSDDDWSSLVDGFFLNDNILKLGYGIREDFSNLVKTVPVMKDIVYSTRLVDLDDIKKQIISQDAFPLKEKGLENTTVVKKEEKGLSQLVRIVLGRPLDKSEQMSDWEKRPLRRSQIVYAALDAHVLLEVYDAIRARNAEFYLQLDLEPPRTPNVLRTSTKLEKKQRKVQEKLPSGFDPTCRNK